MLSTGKSEPKGRCFSGEALYQSHENPKEIAVNQCDVLNEGLVCISSLDSFGSLLQKATHTCRIHYSEEGGSNILTSRLSAYHMSLVLLPLA